MNVPRVRVEIMDLVITILVHTVVHASMDTRANIANMKLMNVHLIHVSMVAHAKIMSTLIHVIVQADTRDIHVRAM